MTVSFRPSGWLAPGDRVAGRYLVEAEIGRGGYSVVYRATDERLGSRVALKLLVPPPASAEIARERMRREALAIRGLGHPHIVPVHDFVEDGPLACIVMACVPGPDLATRVREQGPLLPADAATVGAEIAGALAVAHAAGILHRDVKPQNILLDPARGACLTDFGSARLDGQATITGTGGLVGTLAYSAPELLGGGRGDARADLYALGLTIYFALTGSLPEGGGGQLPPPARPEGFSPAGVNPDVPSWLDQVIRRATALEAGDRFPTADLMAEALAGAGAGDRFDPVRHCHLCDAPDPVGTGLCPACGGLEIGPADTLVMFHAGAKREEARRARALESLAPLASDDAFARAIAGRVALVRVSRAAADRIVRRLTTIGTPARTIPASAAPLPPGFGVLLLAAAGVGIYAGLVALPVLVWTSPAFAMALGWAARRMVQQPAVPLDAGYCHLPPRACPMLADVLGRLPAGTAHRLLSDVARAANGAAEAFGSDRAMQEDLEQVLAHAADAALDLEEMDRTLMDLDATLVRSRKVSSPRLDLTAQCERVRDTLVHRLLDVLGMLGELHRRQEGLDTAPVRGAMQRLEREIRFQREAWDEVDALLDSGTFDGRAAEQRHA